MSSGSSRSANSGQKLKRSFNSIQSNSTNNSNTSVNNNKKNKKSNQKTLGVAWGSNSLSSSRSSFRNSPFSDFGSYMVEKNRKLQNQFDAEASSSSYSASTSGRPIFQGVSIFVDGFTVPSSQELRGYMLKYGGRFENYFSRHRVTHIICSNLPDSKIKNLRSFSGGLPVVKPAWVLDSVAANKLLSWVPYQLDQLANNQPKLSDFFALKRCHFSEDASIPTFYQAKPETADSSLNNGSSKNADLSEQGGSVQHEWQIRGEIEDPVVAVMNEKMTEQQSSFTGKSCEVDTLEPSNADAEIESCVKDELQSRTHEPSPSISSYCVENRDMKGSMSSKKSHSTLGDPNFVENYFKSSRLHFIGTWRHRYRKRFPSCSEFKCTSSSLKVPSDAQRTAIIHVDMVTIDSYTIIQDCFFVSVIIRNHPELQDKPVAICHSDSVKGTAEISSANYPARDYGVKAGMFVRDAKALCPHLVICPYNFEAYEEVADQFYNILHKHCTRVQAVSCDEAFLDVTYLEVEDPEILASKIRKEIFETTGCTASTGIAGNMLMARLATRTAKPNGQCYIPPQRVDEYLHHLPIKALPGIGHVLEEKLRKQNIRTCGQLRRISKDSLQKDFGVKTGEMLWNYSRGIDNRQVGVIQESKSIGAEVNWGVRFRDLKDSHHFLLNLCKEVSLRLQGCGVQGRNFTLKIKKRKKDANEPVKYMGCGDCDNFSHSMTVPVATDDVEVLQRITKQLFGSFHFDVKDIRGIGLQVSKLENADTNKQGIERNTLKSWLTSTSASTEEKSNISRMSEGGTDAIQHSVQMDLNLSTGSRFFESGALNEGRGSLFSELVNLNEELVAMKAQQCAVEEVPAVPVLGAGLFNEAIPNLVRDKIDLMPSSLSQVDTSVLQQLPEPLRADILELLPAHRRQAFSSNAILGPSENLQESMGTKIPENPAGSIDAVGNNNLWVGNPPLWVDKFKASNFLILNMLADIYHKYGSTGNLSQILQHTVSVTVHPPDASSDGWDEAIDNLCELLRQYIKLNIEVDIEEIYVCFRLLRRIMAKSEFFLEVYNTVIPYLQVSISNSILKCLKYLENALVSGSIVVFRLLLRLMKPGWPHKFMVKVVKTVNLLDFSFFCFVFLQNHWKEFFAKVDNRNSSAAKRARTDDIFKFLLSLGSRREDDWTCPSCGNVNFSFRMTCNMRNCTQPRPADHSSKSAAKPMQVPQNYSSSAPYVGSGAPSSMYLGMPPYGSSLFNGSSIPPYDVPFSGGSAYHYNYGSRLSAGSPYRPLHMSGPAPYSGGSMMGNGGMYGMPPPLMDRYGLGLPMGPAAMGPRPGFFPDDKSQKKGADATRDNDWTCPKCGNINFSFRTVCNMRKCNTPKPGSQTAKSDKNSKQKMPEGSWKCEKCNNINYPFRTKCNRQNCGADKPAESKKSLSPTPEENDQLYEPFVDTNFSKVSTRTCLRVEKVQGCHPELLNMGV
ncbi:hypothetical protein Pint_23737 [Pistacia integerrima]|uniref:Uncharacterized protein n=1 Tax=Pistacia integerrima TaxID=434235 RepID=A0ACC0YIY8_9ROSI|nr:hypothetical protein Pint_23737 [Pistacia integerrima]